MIKIIIYAIVLVAIFTGALYLGYFDILSTNIAMVRDDFLPFIPLEIRLGFFAVILSVSIILVKGFTE